MTADGCAVSVEAMVSLKQAAVVAYGHYGDRMRSIRPLHATAYNIHGGGEFSVAATRTRDYVVHACCDSWARVLVS